jgi:hypothetical protein
MTNAQLTMQKVDAAKARQRQLARMLKLEREASQLSSFIFVFGQTLDTLIPFRVGSTMAKVLLRRRINRRLR